MNDTQPAAPLRTKPTILPADGDPRHGTANGYGNLQCRCAGCRTAWAAYMRERRGSA